LKMRECLKGLFAEVTAGLGIDSQMGHDADAL
jgi:hypothetical protein